MRGSAHDEAWRPSERVHVDGPGLVSGEPSTEQINDPASCAREEAHTHEQARCCRLVGPVSCRAKKRATEGECAILVSPEA